MDDYWSWKLRAFPQTATARGVHEYDTELDQYTMQQFKDNKVYLIICKTLSINIIISAFVVVYHVGYFSFYHQSQICFLSISHDFLHMNFFPLPYLIIIHKY